MDFAGIYDNGDDDYMEGLSAVCERIVRGTETLEEQTELFQRLDEEFDLVENRREYIEDEMEEERRDEKNGVYPQHEDVANQEIAMDNPARVKKIKKLLGLRGNDTNTEYYRVADAVTDLMHFCDSKGIDFDQEMRMADTYYISELEEEVA